MEAIRTEGANHRIWQQNHSYQPFASIFVHMFLLRIRSFPPMDASLRQIPNAICRVEEKSIGSLSVVKEKPPYKTRLVLVIFLNDISG